MKSHFRLLIASIAFTTTWATPSYADVLIDTGAGGTSSIGSSSLFNTISTDGFYQNLAGAFTINTPFSISSVEAWMTIDGPGALNLVLRADSAGLPGVSLFSQAFLTSNTEAAHWEPFSGINWQLTGGTFWIALEPVMDSSLSATQPGGVPNPLTSYAFLNDGISWWEPLSSQDTLGYRIVGVPEPSSYILTAFGIVGAALLRRRTTAMRCRAPGLRDPVAIHASRGPGR